jgi:hypothetical protein
MIQNSKSGNRRSPVRTIHFGILKIGACVSGGINL